MTCMALVRLFKQDCLFSNQTQYDGILLLTDFEAFFEKPSAALALALAQPLLISTHSSALIMNKNETFYTM